MNVIRCYFSLTFNILHSPFPLLVHSQMNSLQSAAFLRSQSILIRALCIQRSIICGLHSMDPHLRCRKWLANAGNETNRSRFLALLSTWKISICSKQLISSYRRTERRAGRATDSERTTRSALISPLCSPSLAPASPAEATRTRKTWESTSFDSAHH